MDGTTIAFKKYILANEMIAIASVFYRKIEGGEHCTEDNSITILTDRDHTSGIGNIYLITGKMRRYDIIS